MLHKAQESNRGDDGKLRTLPSCSLAGLQGLDFAITGTSTLEAAAIVAESTEPVSYLNLSRFVAFLEAFLLHDQVVFLGRPNGDASRFCQRLEASSEEKIFQNLPLDPTSDLRECQATLDKLLHGTFGRRLDHVTIERLCKQPVWGRKTSELREEFLRKVEKAAVSDEGDGKSTRDRLITYLVEEFKLAAEFPYHQFLTHHLLRHFLHGAIANDFKGSLPASCIKNPLGPRLVQQNQGVGENFSVLPEATPGGV